MRRRRPSAFPAVPALIELLETRRLLSADAATPGTQMPSGLDASGSESAPKIASDGNGDYVIVWNSNSQDGLSSAIYAQEFNADGNPMGATPTIRPNSSTLQSQPAVAMDAAGVFIIAWTSVSQNGSGSSVDVQRYDLSGAPLGNQITFANTLSGIQSSPSVAIDAQGDYVVAWVNETGPGSTGYVYAQRFDAAGSEEGSTFLVGQSSTAMADQPSVAMDAAGDFVVAWQSVSTSGSVLGIEAQLYNSSGTAMGGELNITPTTAVNPMSPAVAMGPAGDFVITWQSGSVGQTNIYAEQFIAADHTQGSLFEVSGSQVSQNNMTPAAAMNPSGNFVFAWAGDAPNSSRSIIFTQQYNASGTSEGTAEQYSASTTVDQQSPSVTLQPDGNVVVAWNGQPQSSDNSGIFTQQSDQSTALQTDPAKAPPMTTAEPTVPILPPGITNNLPLYPNAGQLGGPGLMGTFFNNPMFTAVEIYPQLLWGTSQPWLALGLNSLYDLLWWFH